MRKSVGTWKPDESVCSCEECDNSFTFWRRRHHCRLCGGIYCWKCSKHRTVVKELSKSPVRICSCCKDGRGTRGGGSPQGSYSAETSTNEGTPGPRICEHSPVGSNNDSAFKSIKSSGLLSLRLSSTTFKSPSSPGPVVTRSLSSIQIAITVPPTMVSSSASQRQKIITACNQQAQYSDHTKRQRAVSDGSVS
eukprot:TRINITY_DN3355_c7_g1_i1.p1 TRINITY_DN3355_c7_g1~~TRINITY_DN3355_c7_g1_i1.p1  ORF type:complete len:193 (+),score=45.30 TRINITY_DN3355_c7_g1_i1:67-645(+)